MRKSMLLALCLVMGIMQVWAQRTISGKVTDGQANPIVGALVVGGTSTGVTTDEQGNFMITVPAEKKSPVVSSVDFVTQELSADADLLNLTLAPGGADLQEIVVVGYGTQDKIAFTGAASKIDPKNFASLVTLSVYKQLAGRAADITPAVDFVQAYPNLSGWFS